MNNQKNIEKGKGLKIDLHTHSSWSFDGGITKKQYKYILEEGILDFIAITDHNETRFARALHEEIGEKIIVGEEIKTQEGDIIGLFLTKTIPSGLPVKEAVQEIRGQGGLVYIPHPFETGRSSLQTETLKEIIEKVDIIETFNGRGRWRGKPALSEQTASEHKVVIAASSDAHSLLGIGTAFSIVKKRPDRESMVLLLREGNLQKNHAPFISLLYPSINKIKNKLFLTRSTLEN